MKKLLSITILLSLISLFSACHDLVFANILEDVPPEEATVNGSINSITRYSIGSNEYLVSYSQDGLIYKSKDDNFHGAWSKYEHLPFTLQNYSYYDSQHYGQQIIKTAADSTTLYIITCEYTYDSYLGTNVPKKFYIWAANLSNWTSDPGWTDLNSSGTFLTFYKEGNYYYTNFNVFCTNAPQKSHRKAFFRNEDKVYNLNGTSAPTVNSSPVRLSSEPAGNGKLDSAIWFGGQIYLLDAIASVTNETYTANPTYYYLAQDESADVYYSNGSAPCTKALDAGEAVSALAVTKDALLIGRSSISTSGTYGGIVKAKVNNWIPESELTGFTTNAAAQMPSSYLINTLLVIDAEKGETETAMYSTMIFRTVGTSSSVNYDNIGMWSYYPSRGNWNRE